MLSKPDACRGCPLYGDGRGFVPDELREDAEITIVAQNPGEYEELGKRVVDYGPRYGHRVTYRTEPCTPAPLIGPTGFQLERDYLPVPRTQVSLCNILKCRVQVKRMATGKVERINEMPMGKTLEAAVAHCTRAHLRIPGRTRLVVAMGAHAVRFFGFPGSVTEWRGFVKP